MNVVRVSNVQRSERCCAVLWSPEISEAYKVILRGKGWGKKEEEKEEEGTEGGQERERVSCRKHPWNCGCIRGPGKISVLPQRL